MSSRSRIHPCVPLLAAGLAVAAGCGLPSLRDDQVVCTAEFRPAVQVTVLDSATGAPVAQGATLLVTDGAYRDSSTTAFAGALSAGGDRAGTYTVVVRQSGYRDWTRAGVTVTGDQCHVTTAKLTALLQH